jgi:hypothetical protein
VVDALFDTPYGTRKFTIRDLDGSVATIVIGALLLVERLAG